MQEADRRRVPTSGAEPSGQEAVDTPVSALHRSQADEQGEKHSYGTKRKFIDIYDESRLGGFIDDASAMGNALDKVLDKSSSAETSKRTFIRQQVQQLNKELLGIAEATYLDMLYKILTQTPEILDAVFQTDRGNKILESLAEKVHKQLPDDLVEAEQQAACLDAVVDVKSELGRKAHNLTQMMVEFMIDCARKEGRVGERPRVVHEPSSSARSHSHSYSRSHL